MRTALAGLLLAIPILSQTLIDGGAWTYSGPARDFATISITSLPDGTTSAIRASTQAATPDTPWNTQASRVLPPTLDKNRWLRFRLWARSDTSNRIGLVHELNSGAYTKSLDYTLRLSTEWKEYAISYQCGGYAPGGSALRIRTGYDNGSVELANIRLEDF